MKKTEFQRFESVMAKLDYRMTKAQENRDKKKGGSSKQKKKG